MNCLIRIYAVCKFLFLVLQVLKQITFCVCVCGGGGGEGGGKGGAGQGGSR